MKKLAILVMAAAIAAPTSFAFAGASNPMSQSYNARAVGKSQTHYEQMRQNRKQQKTMKTGGPTQQQPQY